MQYNIFINQHAAYMLGLQEKLDLTDLALFDFIYHTMNNPAMPKTTIDGEDYWTIRASLVIQECPLLGIKNRISFHRRMQKLREVGLIERYGNNQKENTSLYKKGAIFTAFVMVDNSTITYNIQPATEKLHPVTKMKHPLQPKCNTPVFQNCNTNIIPSNNIIPNEHNTTPISIFPPIGENTLIPPEGECESSQQIEEVSKDELEFDKFRKVYRGTKRGLKTEFDNFKKKHRDWREVLKTLQACYEHQCELKDAARKKGCFVPQEKNLQTYINQRCWEEEPQFAPAKVEKEEPTIIDRLRGIEESRRERERVDAFFDEIIEQEKRQQKTSNYEPF